MRRPIEAANRRYNLASGAAYAADKWRRVLVGGGGERCGRRVARSGRLADALEARQRAATREPLGVREMSRADADNRRDRRSTSVNLLVARIRVWLRKERQNSLSCFKIGDHTMNVFSLFVILH